MSGRARGVGAPRRLELAAGVDGSRKLGIEQWASREMHTRYRKLSEIDLSGIEYDPSSKTGVILVNWGTVLVGKISVLIAGPETVRIHVEKKLAGRL